VLIDSNRYDPVVPWTAANQLGRDWCALGVDVEFRTNEEPPTLGRGHGEPAPAGAGAVKHHSHQRQAECSPGNRPITLTRRRVSPKVHRIRAPHPVAVLAREPQVHGERLAVLEQTPHRRRVGVEPARGQRVDAVLRNFDRLHAGGNTRDR